jgi:hypothetical protein
MSAIDVDLPHYDGPAGRAVTECCKGDTRQDKF